MYSPRLCLYTGLRSVLFSTLIIYILYIVHVCIPGFCLYTGLRPVLFSPLCTCSPGYCLYTGLRPVFFLPLQAVYTCTTKPHTVLFCLYTGLRPVLFLPLQAVYTTKPHTVSFCLYIDQNLANIVVSINYCCHSNVILFIIIDTYHFQRHLILGDYLLRSKRYINY